MRNPRVAAIGIVCLGITLTLVGAQCADAGPHFLSFDSTAELQAKLDQLKPGATLKLDRKTYLHSGIIHLRVPGVRIDGNGATLQATNDETSAVQINADGVSLNDLKLTAPSEGKRWSGLGQNKLVIEANGVTVSDVTITGSAAAGVFVYGASHFTLNRVTVRNSRADGIHMTNGSNNGQVNNPTTDWTGDDGVAVVSYGNEKPCQNIVVNAPTVNGTTWGRGLSVVGGENISYRDVRVSRTNAAGVYIASEGDPYYTLSTNKVDVVGGTVTGANVNPQISQGAVLVYSQHADHSVGNVTISGLTISETPKSARFDTAISVDDGTVSNISFANIKLEDTDLAPLYISAKVPAGSFTLSDWSRDGQPITVP